MKRNLLITTLLLLLVFLFTSCSGNSPTSENGTSTFGLNEAAAFDNLKFTATEISESTGTQFFSPEEGNIFVGIKFTIENISSEEQTVSSILLFEPYCDDVKLDYSISAASVFEGTLDGTLATGKKLVGYYAVEVPTTWSTIELEVKSSWISSQSVTFVFNNSDNNEAPENNTTNAATPNDTTSEETPNINVPTKKTYGLNDTATVDSLKFTATEITESTGSQFFTPDDGKVFVGIKFTIENISSQDQSISSLLLFSAYCDDIKLDYSFNASVAFSETLDGTLSPGKKMIGYYSVEVPTTWKTIELEAKADWTSNDSATFIFNK